MPIDNHVNVQDAIHALAFVGDLSMGQPTDHSLRTAWLSGRLAEAAGLAPADVHAAQQVSLLRWAGCTANAPEFSALLGDDVGGRQVMMDREPDEPSFGQVSMLVQAARQSLTQIHCEVSGDIARTLGLAAEVERGLRCIFESYDGSGPLGLSHDQFPRCVYLVELASDLEIIARVQGLPRALAMVAARAEVAYPAEFARRLATHAAGWLDLMDRDEGWRDALRDTTALSAHTVPLELVADVIDLKLPWMTGHSRRVAEAAQRAAAAIGLDAAAQSRSYRAGLIHGMGRAAVPNTVWNTPGRLPPAARERVRLVPYWTARAAGQVGSLSADADVASYTGERLDGSGTFRSCTAAATPVEGQVVAAAAAWVALGSPRPWRKALPSTEAGALLLGEARAGRFNQSVVQALCGTGARPRPVATEDTVALTARELEIFRCISRGQTNKEVARALDISPSTVRTHVENVFRKFGCTTRAAATLKAAALGLLA